MFKIPSGNSNNFKIANIMDITDPSSSSRVWSIKELMDAINDGTFSNSIGYSNVHWRDISGNITTVDNVPETLPVFLCPTAVKASSNIISRSYDDMNGDFQDWPLAHKVKLIWQFDATSDHHVYNSTTHQYTRTPAVTLISNLMNGYIFPSIQKWKTRVFFISGWVHGYGDRWGVFYLGTPTNFQSEGVRAGSTNYAANAKFELHWIEVGDESTHIQSLAEAFNFNS